MQKPATESVLDQENLFENTNPKLQGLRDGDENVRESILPVINEGDE